MTEDVGNLSTVHADVIELVRWESGRCWVTGGIGVALHKSEDYVCVVLIASLSWNRA